ncbi:hypothetical protein JVU11DRAFT_4946 [Chiua virens]|nr:hypothetical protein JVU11DRAFT_4946 [Chiua virens]
MSETILLCPRPLARYGGRFVLLPLLPQQPPLKPLPAEIWSKIFSLALSADASQRGHRQAHHWQTPMVRFADVGVQILPSYVERADEAQNPTHPHQLIFDEHFAQSRNNSLTLNPQEVACPLLYSNVKISTVGDLDKFTARLRTADQTWDSIRRIPYSTPGRWVQTFDVSEITVMHDSRQAFVVDSLLTTVFPLMPFMENLKLSSSLPLSRRAFVCLTSRDGNSNLRILSGVCYVPAFSSSTSVEEDPVVRLLQKCHRLERLEVMGSDMQPADGELDSQDVVEIPGTDVKLDLPRLKTLILLSMPSSSLTHALISAILPRLKVLHLTPYDDIPYPRALTTRFLDVHGESLSTLSLFTPKCWPTRFHPSPRTVLRTCPNVRHLSLETPLPALLPPDPMDTGKVVIPLQILSIPRPNHDFWRTLEALLPSFPSLSVVRMRDTRWLRKGLSSHAQEAGVQGEMRVWRQRLAKRGIYLLDGDWKDIP